MYIQESLTRRNQDGVQGKKKEKKTKKLNNKIDKLTSSTRREGDRMSSSDEEHGGNIRVDNVLTSRLKRSHVETDVSRDDLLVKMSR